MSINEAAARAGLGREAEINISALYGERASAQSDLVIIEVGVL